MHALQKSEKLTADKAQARSQTGSQAGSARPGTTGAMTVTLEGPTGVASMSGEGQGAKMRTMLKAKLGDDVFSSWFNTLDFDRYDGRVVWVSVPVKFLRTWIGSHYGDVLLECCRAEFKVVERVEVILRQPGGNPATRGPEPVEIGQPANDGGAVVAREQTSRPSGRPAISGATNGVAGGFASSPLDPRYTFSSFVVGASNRMAHAGATQVAETVLRDSPSFNPLYIHSSVGLGKTHLLHAIAWEVKRRTPEAQVLYLTAERFRYQFVEALRGSDPMAFKEKFRQIHILLIDDLEFLHGERTEQEFDHIINSMLDGSRHVVVASARPPNHIERLNERMRSRLQRGLVTEIEPLDQELRIKVLETRLSEKQAGDASFTLSSDVLAMLAERLTENGRELEGAITRLHATWQYMRTPLTMDIVETVIRDLVHSNEPRRIKIEDILRIVSRHFGVSKGDLLSQRRHRSVVWPRQIGMYLAKQLTARSLPEIGRRFGNRDHTTVLHAIRKIDGILTDNPRLREEIEELKKLLSH